MTKKNDSSSKNEKQNLKIRTATVNDEDRIHQIEVLSFKDAYPKSLIWQLLQDKNAICLLIEMEQKIVGFAIGMMRYGNMGHIVSIAIDPEYRKLALGSHLVTRMIATFKERGAILIELEVRVSNEIAQKLYKKFDFQIQEIKQRYYNDGEDAYLMVRNLNTEKSSKFMDHLQ